jgi:hypothetical protein
MAQRNRRPRGKLQVARDFKAITVRLAPQTFGQLDAVLENTGMSITGFIEYAIELHHNVLGLSKRPLVTPAQARKAFRVAAARSRVDGNNDW